LIPIDRIFRIIWFGASSNAQKKQRSLFWHTVSAKEAEMLVFPVPAEPDIRMLLPTKKPFLSSISSKAFIPEEILSKLVFCSSASLIIGKTVIPFVSIKKGYSLLPWREPRYLTMRILRVVI